MNGLWPAETLNWLSGVLISVRDYLRQPSRELDKVQGMIDRGLLKQKDKIGLRVGRIINKYKMAKHFILDIGEHHLPYQIDEKKVAEEASLDGIYIIRTSLSQVALSLEDTGSPITKTSVTSSRLFDRLRLWIYWFNLFTTAWRSESGLIFLSVCWHTMSSGICLKHGDHCSLQMKIWQQSFATPAGEKTYRRRASPLPLTRNYRSNRHRRFS